jgi:hypothetical protein
MLSSECVPVGRMKRLEPGRPAQVGAQTVNDSMLRKHLVDRCYPAVVPDLVKPSANKRFVFDRHEPFFRFNISLESSSVNLRPCLDEPLLRPWETDACS